MIVILKRQALSFLLGIGLLLCLTEGFVGMHRIIPFTTTQEILRGVNVKEIMPLQSRACRRQHPHIVSSLRSTMEEQTSKTRTTLVNSISSQEIHEMASFVCVRLIQVVMAKTLAQDYDQEESMDIEALERLASALQKSKSDDDGDEKSLSPTATISASDSSNVETLEPKREHVEEKDEEPSPLETSLSLESAEEEESITSDLVDAGWDDEFEDDFHDMIPHKEEEIEVYPEGSVPLPRAETPTYVVSPLEVVASNVVPLRPSSIPRKKTPTVIPGDRGEQIATVSTEEEKDKPLEVLTQVEEEKIESFAERESDIIFDASRAWELDEILTSTTKTVENSIIPERQNVVEMQTALRAEELFRRKLLKRRLEMDTLRKSIDETDSISNVEIGSHDERTTKQVDLEAHRVAEEKRIVDIQAEAAAIEQKSEELLQRKLLKQQLELERAAAAATQRKSQELFQRKLLKQQLEFVTRESARSRSIEEEKLRKTSAELFQRRLLAKKFEFDSTALKAEMKKDEYLFRRRLLEKIIEYETSRIQTEWRQRRRSTKKFEYATKAIEIIKKEREEAKTVTSNSVQHLSNSEKEDTQNEVTPSVIVDEKSEFGNMNGDFVSEQTKDTFSLDTTKTVKEEAIQVLRDDNTETVQADVKVLDSVPNSNVPDMNEDTSKSNNASPQDDWVSSLPTITQQRYAKEAEISHSFQPREFNPAIWSRNNHFQTIVGTLFRKETMYSRGTIDDAGIFLDVMGVGNMSDEARKPLEDFSWDKRFRVETNDGDFYVADWKYANGEENCRGGDDENPVCLICHGLESCSDSEIVQEVAIACNENGIDAACLNFRGCQDSGTSFNLTPRSYHLGFTDDLMQQIEEVHAKNPNRRIYLSGFSLGAGVVTRLLTQLGPKAYDYNICGAAVNAVPFDVGQHHMALNEPGFTKSVYGDRLLQSMKTRMAKQYDQCGFTFEKSKIEECKNIMDAENLVICPVFGFDDAYDYYDKVKTLDKLQKVCVPQFVIQARDDPFFVGLGEVANDESIPLRIQYTDYGGHCGYILHQREPDEKNCKTSWMPRQLARFFAHVEEKREPDN